MKTYTKLDGPHSTTILDGPDVPTWELRDWYGSPFKIWDAEDAGHFGGLGGHAFGVGLVPGERALTSATTSREAAEAAQRLLGGWAVPSQ